MKKLTKMPTCSINETFNDCISSFRDKTTTANFELIRSDVIAESTNLGQCFSSKSVYISSAKSSMSFMPVSEKGMIKLYDDKLVGHPNGRKHYDSIMLLAENNICPNCGVRQVRTLDHFMAKSIYPLFAITPINLYPCCSNCNTDKKSILYSSFENTPLNPYYDDFSNDEWLNADMNINGDIPIFSFKVLAPLAWTNSDILKITNHCATFKLFSLYSFEANSEYIGNKVFFESFKRENNPDGLKVFFERMYNSNRSVDLNSFKTAMYKCLLINYLAIYSIL